MGSLCPRSLVRRCRRRDGAQDARGRRSAESRLQRLGPRHAASRRRELVRRAELRRLAQRKTGKDDAYRLPSEAEWECRTRRHDDGLSWGAKLDHNYGNFGIRGRGSAARPKAAIPGRTRRRPSLLSAERVRPLRHARQHLRVDRGLLRGRSRAAPVDGSANKEGNCANRVFRNGTFMSNPYMQRRHGAALRIRRRAAGATI